MLQLTLEYAVTEIGEGARALKRTTECSDGVLSVLVDQLTAMARLLWHIEDFTGLGHSPALNSAWEDDDVRTVQLYMLPTLILAAEHAAEDPSAAMFMSDRRYWCVLAVAENADRLIAWAERHAVAKEVAHV